MQVENQNTASVDKEALKIRNACGLLHHAARSIRVLTRISWPLHVRETFFANKAKELPKVEYEEFDPSDAFERLVFARHSFKFSPEINKWLNKIAFNIEQSARMLAATGTADFFRYSKELYGEPEGKIWDADSTPLELAQQFDEAFSQFQKLDLGAPETRGISAEELAKSMRAAARIMFGEEAPDVFVVPNLSANALAGPTRIRIRQGAKFTKNDVNQLINHEASIHVATSLNGMAQENLRILAANHPGVTRTQEGLAVFAEFITGSMDLNRFHRLADRVLAIQMAAEGADFLEVYQFFLDRSGREEQSYENTRRVFRGGLITGGAPFTKDVVYLDGLLHVHNFMRTSVAAGRADCLRLLFCGKLDLEDLPVIGHLAERGIAVAPKYLPNWAKDIRFLLCYLTYSSFLNKIDLEEGQSRYGKMIDSIPKIGHAVDEGEFVDFEE